MKSSKFKEVNDISPFTSTNLLHHTTFFKEAADVKLLCEFPADIYEHEIVDINEEIMETTNKSSFKMWFSANTPVGNQWDSAGRT